MSTLCAVVRCAVEGCGEPRSSRGWCRVHYARWQRHGDPEALAPRRSPEEQFWLQVDKDGPTPTHRPELGPCWEWTAYRDECGYGRTALSPRTRQAHRLAYEWRRGPVPSDLEIDHLCRNRGCVNPDHLEAVTHAENMRRARRTHCAHGHPLDDVNTYIAPDGHRHCRVCGRAANRRHREKNARGMKFSDAIDEFLADKRSEGRITSERTVAGYRLALDTHARDIGNRDPRTVGREDVKRTLRRWDHPNTQAYNRAVLVSFYRWCVQEGRRKDNPAEQTRPPKRRKPSVYRLTRAEAVRLMRAAETNRERRVIYLGLLTGARNEEMRSLQRRHFERKGFVWFSDDVAKGNRERFVPVLVELEPVVAEILAHTRPGDYVVPARRSVGGRTPNLYRELPQRQCSTQALIDVVVAVGERAGIAARIKPHSLRHAFGDHVTRQAGLRAAQEVLGHADVSTTEGTYTGRVTLDELAAALAWFRYDGYPSPQTTEGPDAAPLRTLPADAASGDSTEGKDR